MKLSYFPQGLSYLFFNLGLKNSSNDGVVLLVLLVRLFSTNSIYVCAYTCVTHAMSERTRNIQ